MLPGRGNLRGRDRGRGLRGVAVRDNDERSRRGSRSVRFATQGTGLAPVAPRVRRGNYQIPSGQAQRESRTTTSSPNKAAEQPDKPIASISRSQGTFQQRYQLLKGHREKERIAAIADGFLADPDRPRTLAEAITPVGTCQDMCAEFERVERVVQNDVWGPELDPNIPSNAQGATRQLPNEGRMVKKFRRAAAGIDEQLPSDLRPPLVLQKTLDYLFNDLIGQAQSLASVHHFVWDRTRAVRNDFSIQQVSNPAEIGIAIESYERIARFHILSLHQLAGPNRSYDKYDAQQEREQLDKTLLSLMQYYDDSRGRMQFVNEAEFRAYCIIFQIQDPVPDLEDRVQTWPTDIIRNGRVQCALQVYAAASNTADAQGPLKPRASHPIAQENWRKFWRLVDSNYTSYLMACVAEIYFSLVRRTALNAIWQAYRQGGQMKTEDWSLSELARALGFDDEDDVRNFCGQYGFSIEERADQTPYLDLTSVTGRKLSQPSLVQFAKRSEMVERKRCNRTFSAVINGMSVRAAEEAGLIEETPNEDAMEHERPKNDSLFISGDSDEENRPANTPKTLTASVKPSVAKSSLRNSFGTKPLSRIINTDADLKISTNPTPEKSDLDQPISISSTTSLDPWRFEKASTGPLQQIQDSSKPFSFLSNPPADPGNEGPAAFPEAASFSTSKAISPTVFNFTQPPTITLSNAQPPTSTPAPFDPNLTASQKSAAKGFNMGIPSSFSRPDLHESSQNKPFSFGGHPSISSLDQSKPPASHTSVIRPNVSAGQSSVFVGSHHSQKPTNSSLPTFAPSPNFQISPFSLPAPNNTTSFTKDFRKPSPQNPSSPFQSSAKPITFPSNHLDPQHQNFKSQQASSSVTDAASEQLDLFTQEGALHSSRPLTGPPPVTLIPSSLQTRPFLSSSTIPLFDLQRTQTVAPSISIESSTSSRPSHLSAGSTAAKEQVAQNSEAAKAKKSKVLDHLARTMVLERFGFIDQFVEFTAGPLIIAAQEKVKQERLRQKADDFRLAKVTYKYAKKWRDICWNRRLSRQGRDRRRRLARDMQEKERQSRGNSISAGLQAFRDSLSSSSSRLSTGAITRQDEFGARPQCTTERDRRKDKGTTMTFNANSPRGQDRVSPPGQKPYGHAKSVSETSLHRSKGPDATTANDPQLSSSLGDFFLPEGFLSSHSPLAASSPRVDTTRSTYFRLKAMGLDPRGKTLSLIPTSSTSDRKRNRDTDSDASATPGKKLHASGSSSLVGRLQPDTLYAPPVQNTRAPVANEEDEELFAAVRAARNAMSDSISFFQDELKQDELRKSQVNTDTTILAPTSTPSAPASNAVVNELISNSTSLRKEPPPAYRNRISKFLPRSMYADVMMRRRRDTGASTAAKSAGQRRRKTRGWPRALANDGHRETEDVDEHSTRKPDPRDGQSEIIMETRRGIENQLHGEGLQTMQLPAYASVPEEVDVQIEHGGGIETQAQDDTDDEDDEEDGEELGEAAQHPDYFVSNATDEDEEEEEEEKENGETDSPYANGESYMTNGKAFDGEDFGDEDLEDDRGDQNHVDRDGSGYGADDMDQGGDNDDDDDDDEEEKRSPAKWPGSGKAGTSVDDAIEL